MLLNSEIADNIFSVVGEDELVPPAPSWMVAPLPLRAVIGGSARQAKSENRMRQSESGSATFPR